MEQMVGSRCRVLNKAGLIIFTRLETRRDVDPAIGKPSRVQQLKYQRLHNKRIVHFAKQLE